MGRDPEGVSRYPGARAERKTLERELASYTAPRDLHDLDAILHRYSDDETAEIRSILTARRA